MTDDKLYTQDDGPFNGPTAEVRALHGFLQYIAAKLGLGPDIESYDDVCNALDTVLDHKDQAIRELQQKEAHQRIALTAALKVQTELIGERGAALEQVRELQEHNDFLERRLTKKMNKAEGMIEQLVRERDAARALADQLGDWFKEEWKTHVESCRCYVCTELWPAYEARDWRDTGEADV